MTDYGTILSATSGSTSTGTDIYGVSDLDTYGIIQISRHDWMWDPRQTQNYRPGHDLGEKTRPGAWDGTYHSPLKFAQLALNNNPQCLALLYTEPLHITSLGQHLLDIREAFVSKKAKVTFQGFARSELDKLVDRGWSSEPPHYDTKLAARAATLAYQGIEYLKTGHMSLPLPQKHRRHVRIIRLGMCSKVEAVSDITALVVALDSINISHLPDEPNRGLVTDWLHACLKASTESET